MLIPFNFQLKITISILVSIVIGGILADQYQFLAAFFKNSGTHFIIALVLITAMVWLGKNARIRNRGYFILNTIFLFFAFKGAEIVLKTHEFMHLSYLLSYLIIIVVAGFTTVFYVKMETFKKTNYLIIFGVIVGFLWKSSNWMPDLFFIVFISGLVGSLFYLFESKESRFQFYILLLLLLPLITDLIINGKQKVYNNQSQYADRVIYSAKTSQHHLDITSWKGNHWVYYDNKVQFSSLDEWLYSEPMVHTLMSLIESKKRILIIGGENGILVKELLKYDAIEVIDLLVLDPELYNLASNPLLININQGSLKNKRVNIVSNNDLKISGGYHGILIDVPDPINEKWNAYYSQEFYNTCYGLLHDQGALITQAGSPYFASKAFVSIEKTIQASGFSTLPLHNQILSLGEWGWVLASKVMSSKQMKLKLLQFDTSKVETKWLNSKAMQMLASFGKPLLNMDSVEINSIENSVLIDYYQKGNYKFK